MSNLESITIQDLGYGPFFESNRIGMGLDEFPVARVISEYKESYRVKNDCGEYPAKVTGKQIFNAFSRENYPAVGDWVAINELNKEQAVIQALLPRQTVMKRKYSGKNETQIIAANIDVAFIIESVDRDFSLNRFDRYFALAREGGILPAIILNKIDLISHEELNSKTTKIQERFKDIVFIPTSVVTAEGLDQFRVHLEKGRTYCFLGSSGVGKSSLINKLLGRTATRTGDISSYSGRGKHVTTSRQMYFLEGGGMIIDNPGMRELGMTNADTGIDAAFDEISSLAEMCKYSDCTHINEPGCSVLSALKSGNLDAGKYENYLSLKKEAAFYEMTESERRKRDRKFGKFFKKRKKDFKRLGHKNY
jgi:ribosome biogenesis GTPase